MGGCLRIAHPGSLLHSTAKGHRILGVSLGEGVPNFRWLVLSGHRSGVTAACKLWRGKGKIQSHVCGKEAEPRAARSPHPSLVEGQTPGQDSQLRTDSDSPSLSRLSVAQRDSLICGTERQHGGERQPEAAREPPSSHRATEHASAKGRDGNGETFRKRLDGETHKGAQGTAGWEQSSSGPRAHLDLLLQVFSSGHEVLNLPKEDTPMGCRVTGAFKLLSSSLLMLVQPSPPSEHLTQGPRYPSLLQKAFPTEAAQLTSCSWVPRSCLSQCPDPQLLCAP